MIHKEITITKSRPWFQISTETKNSCAYTRSQLPSFSALGGLHTRLTNPRRILHINQPTDIHIPFYEDNRIRTLFWFGPSYFSNATSYSLSSFGLDYAKYSSPFVPMTNTSAVEIPFTRYNLTIPVCRIPQIPSNQCNSLSYYHTLGMVAKKFPKHWTSNSTRLPPTFVLPRKPSSYRITSLSSYTQLSPCSDLVPHFSYSSRNASRTYDEHPYSLTPFRFAKPIELLSYHVKLGTLLGTSRTTTYAMLFMSSQHGCSSNLSTSCNREK